MEPVEVTARFTADGKIIPQSFSWRNKNYPVAAVGRSWENETGRHILVMTPGDRVFELILVSASNLWFLNRLDRDRFTA